MRCVVDRFALGFVIISDTLLPLAASTEGTSDQNLLAKGTLRHVVIIVITAAVLPFPNICSKALGCERYLQLVRLVTGYSN